MLTKVSYPNHLATPNIIKFYSTHNDKINSIDKIQDNMEGYLIIKYKNFSTKLYNYHLDRFYLYDKIQINFNGSYIIKHIDSFNQNNLVEGNRLRIWVLHKINQIDKFEFNINSILGIGGEYYLYWIKMIGKINLIGISNHETIISDAIINIPWSKNYLVDYNILSTYPKIDFVDLILINLFQINSNIIKYINNIKFKKIILIACNLPDIKLKLLANNFKLVKIKYFKIFNNFLRIIEMEKKK